MTDIIDIESYKKDLSFQLTFEEIDWDYFIETAKSAKELNEKMENKKKKNKTPNF